MSNPGISTIPQSLEAGSLEELRLLMLGNNEILGAWCNYRWIQNVDGKWYAFFDYDDNEYSIYRANDEAKKRNR